MFQLNKILSVYFSEFTIRDADWQFISAVMCRGTNASGFNPELSRRLRRPKGHLSLKSTFLSADPRQHSPGRCYDESSTETQNAYEHVIWAGTTWQIFCINLCVHFISRSQSSSPLSPFSSFPLLCEGKGATLRYQPTLVHQVTPGLVTPLLLRPDKAVRRTVSTGRQQSQSRPHLKVLGEPHEDQATFLLRMCREA